MQYPYDVSQAAMDVLDERSRQIEKEGFSIERDDQYAEEELAQAAMCYTYASIFGDAWRFVKQYWPWSEKWMKLTTPRRNLVKAAALIIAEIERLDRKSANEGK